MPSPRTGITQLADGRALAWADYGPLDATPIVYFSGLAHDRMACGADSDAARVIVVERPGLGGSSRLPGRRIADFTDDVLHVLDDLGVDRFSTLGWSAGGPYALACCARAADRVTAATLVSSMTPTDLGLSAFGMDPAARCMLAAARRSRAAVVGPLSLMRWQAQHSVELLLRMMYAAAPACDRQVLAQPATRQMFRAAYRAVGVEGAAGLIDEVTLLARPWGFDVVECRVDVRVVYGTEDTLTPPKLGVALADRLPTARVEPSKTKATC